MLQTCKHDTAKLIFQKVLIFLSNNFFYLQIFMLLFAHFCIFWYSTIFTQRTLEILTFFVAVLKLSGSFCYVVSN